MARISIRKLFTRKERQEPIQDPVLAQEQPEAVIQGESSVLLESTDAEHAVEWPEADHQAGRQMMNQGEGDPSLSDEVTHDADAMQGYSGGEGGDTDARDHGLSHGLSSGGHWGAAQPSVEHEPAIAEQGAYMGDGAYERVYEGAYEAPSDPVYEVADGQPERTEEIPQPKRSRFSLSGLSSLFKRSPSRQQMHEAQSSEQSALTDESSHAAPDFIQAAGVEGQEVQYAPEAPPLAAQPKQTSWSLARLFKRKSTQPAVASPVDDQGVADGWQVSDSPHPDAIDAEHQVLDLASQDEVGLVDQFDESAPVQTGFGTGAHGERTTSAFSGFDPDDVGLDGLADRPESADSAVEHRASARSAQGEKWVPAGPKLLGQRLIEAACITKQQLDLALRQQKLLLSSGRALRLGEILVRNRFCTIDDIQKALSLQGREVTEVLEDKPLLAPADIQRFRVIPVEIQGATLVIKTDRALSRVERDNIRQACTTAVTGLRTVLVDRHEVHNYLSRQGVMQDNFASVIDRLRMSEQTPALLKSAIDAMLNEAINKRASDIHIDYKPDPDSWVSLRIDSIIQQSHLVPERVMAAIISRIKTLSDMDASNSRSAQDGRMQIDYRGRSVSFRVATQPLVNGETMTIRVIDAGSLPTVHHLFPGQPGMVELLTRVARTDGKAGGLMLVTGATGSGKSTTLYTLSSLFPRDAKNVITVEDPVEYTLPFARQIQIHQLLAQKATDIERSVLRQDPDVLIFGEIRDIDSARAALKFAESGHLVLATLHAKSASQSVERLLSIVPESDRAEAAFVLATTLLAVIHQTLARRLCTCAVPMFDGSPDSAEHVQRVETLIGQVQKGLGHRLSRFEAGNLMKSSGCHRCGNTGYRGRVAVHETILFSIDESKRTGIANKMARTGDTAGLLSADGVQHLTRRDVATTLLKGGIIDTTIAFASAGVETAADIAAAGDQPGDRSADSSDEGARTSADPSPGLGEASSAEQDHEQSERQRR